MALSLAFLCSNNMYTVQFLWSNGSSAFNLCISQLPALTRSQIQLFQFHSALSWANTLFSFWGVSSQVTPKWPLLRMRTWVSFCGPWITTNSLLSYSWMYWDGQRRMCLTWVSVLPSLLVFFRKLPSSFLFWPEWDNLMSLSVYIIKTVPCGWILAWLAALAHE